MSEYSAQVCKEELVYTFEEGVLTCKSSTQAATNTTLSIDLNSTPVEMSRKKGWPSQFMFSMYGMLFGTGICAYMGAQDFLKGDKVGLVTSVIAWVVLMIVLGYFSVKNRKKHSYLTLRAKDKSGINVICSQPEKTSEFEAFAQEIREFAETTGLETDD